jgi:hypothetical protein
MEPITTAAIVSAIGLYLADKMGGEVAKEAGKALWEKCKTFLIGEPILQLFHQAHDSPNVQKQLEAKLDEKLTRDTGARRELEDIFRQLPQQVKHNVINITGDGNVALQDVQGSDIKINK